MYLKSITLKGFKSFPDRTRLELGPGVSVIVGPNGSGKSNVTDAVLWAMGEQSPLAVRGQSMQDVIFAGAPGRQAARGAEVELVLDDSGGVLGIGPEVSIVRRLDRSGEGEYRIAGARCRLADVIELLSDTGLGKEMHSVISQGRVEAIVTSKPRDRRLLIEEAAGLGKHRKRRRRAQLKLQRTLENLDRALDVEREARSRLKPLKRQAEAAELHARLERQTLEARWELSRDDVRARRHTLAEASAAAAQARQATDAVERELGSVAKRREAAEEALAGRGAQREQLQNRVYATRSAGERVGYRADSLRASAARIAERIERSAATLLGLEAEAQADVPDPEAAERIAAVERELESLARDREAELARQVAELEQQRGALAGEIARLDAELTNANQARQLAEVAVEEARRQAREREREVDAARREAARVGGELAAVNRFLQAHAGAPGGAAALADALQVEDGYELALAAALDGRLGAAVVGARDEAESLLDRAGADGGRVLIARAAARPEPRDPTSPHPAAERLLAHVRGDGPAIDLVRTLLADVWVVEALDQVPPGFAGTAVTRSGRVWTAAAHEVRQAPKTGEERVLAERNRRERLIAESEDKVRGEVAARAAENGARDALARADAAREEAIACHRAAVSARDEAAEHDRRLAHLIQVRRTAPDDGPEAGRRAQLAAELAAERKLAERAARERAERQARIERLQGQIARDEALMPGVARLVAATEGAAEAIAVRGAAFEAELEADRAAGEHVAAELRRCAQEEAALQSRLHAAHERLTGAEVQAQRARDQAAEAEHELRELASRLELEAEPATEELPAEQRDALQARLERLVRRREQLGPVNPLAQEEYAEALAHVEELEQQRTDLETAMRELQRLITDTDRQIRETFEQTFESAARNFEELATELFPGGKGRLRLVTEQPPAPRVLGGQASGDEDAGATEEPADGEELEDEEGGEDLVGVEIEITPAGKEMKRLSLLSGGEKSMTALAFLFSVFLAKPCPFYILDEVEAALDDLNIDRFLELLRQYSQRAQFIVVTHQKRTMEAADCLYGVSMGGDGISKVISRRLPPVAVAS
jgi:chromosome segregation protein